MFDHLHRAREAHRVHDKAVNALLMASGRIPLRKEVRANCACLGSGITSSHEGDRVTFRECECVRWVYA